MGTLNSGSVGRGKLFINEPLRVVIERSDASATDSLKSYLKTLSEFRRVAKGDQHWAKSPISSQYG